MPEEALREAVTNIQIGVFEARKKRGWSQIELAEKIGRTNQQVSRALTGPLTPDAISTREAIYKILGMDEQEV